MDTKQYIGARYVPKFFAYNNGEWLENTQYEPLTIVQYSGNSYTSKKEVPANIGNPSSNPEYWASTGNYNAQVEAYRQEVQELSSDVSDLSNDIDDLSDDIDNFAKFSGRKFIFIGDSYNTDSVADGGWGNILINRLGLTEGVNVWNSGHGGDSFSGGSFLSQITTIANSMTSDVKNSITDVLLVGSVNDNGSDGTALVTGVRNFDNYVHTNFPNAKYHLVLAGWGASRADMREQLLTNYTLIENANNTASIYECFQNLMLPNNILFDMVHPSADGMTLLSENCISILQGGGVYFDKNKKTSVFKEVGGGNTYTTITGRLTESGLCINNLEEYHGAISCGNMSFDRTYKDIAFSRLGDTANELFLRECEFTCPAFITRNDSNNQYINTTLAVKIYRGSGDTLYTWYLAVKTVGVCPELASFTIDTVEGVILQIPPTLIGYIN